MKKVFNHLIEMFAKCCLLSVLFIAAQACNEKDNKENNGQILLDSEQVTYSLSPDGETCTINFMATTSWEASLNTDNLSATKNAATEWLTLDKNKGIGGKIALKITAGLNQTDLSRKAVLKLACGSDSKELIVEQAGNSVKIMTESEVKDFDKYYKPTEFKGMDMLRSDTKWSWFRAKQSEHFFVFWEPEFGDDPNASTVPSNLRVDIDDLLKKAEAFYKTNVEVLKFAESGQSYLDKYKMEIYLIYQDEWLATGSGYDNTIGALWVNPSTCQPVGSTIAHEIGHSFQYQIYCDKLYNGGVDDSKQGFRYGYEGSNGGNGFWEQCAQWQSFQDYPEQLFPNYHFGVWMTNYHRHFSHEWMRYASYWLQYYWAEKYGIDEVANIWKSSQYPEDPLQTYLRLHCGNQLDVLYSDLFDYATRMATFDIGVIRDYAADYQGKYVTKLYESSDKYYQVAYASCPGTTGFNVIDLNIPVSGTSVRADFVGLQPGSSLALNDAGEYMESETIKGKVETYNNINADHAGWRYAFVALQSDGKRVYGDVYDTPTGMADFIVPANTVKLYFIVMGAPDKYVAHPWDEKELNDEQWPYKVKFENTDLSGSVTIDPEAKPQSVVFSYNLNFPADALNYSGATVDLKTNGDLQKIAQSFVLQPSVLIANMLPAKTDPQEGKIAFGAILPTGLLSYSTTANGYGFWFNSQGNITNWGSDNDSKIFVEFSTTDFSFTIGQYPGKSNPGDSYVIKEALIYTVGGITYQASFVFNITID